MAGVTLNNYPEPTMTQHEKIEYDGLNKTGATSPKKEFNPNDY